MELSGARIFRLAVNTVRCDAEGLQIGSVPLLTRDTAGAWKIRDEAELDAGLEKAYGFRVTTARKRQGLGVVAKALTEGDIARAQVAALLMQWPDPPPPGKASDRLRLATALAASNLLKADADWDAKHPRTGTAPNPGWFATTGGAGEDDGHDGRTAPDYRDASLTLAPPEPLFASNLLPETLEALTALAARFAGPAAFLGVILIPSSNQVVEQGVVPDRPDMTYSWAHDGTSVRFGLTIDDQSKPLVNGTIGTDNLVRDPDGNVIGRIVSGPNGQTLVADLSALDGAAAKLRGDVTASTSAAKEEPKLCPDPTAEPMTTTSPNSIAYQEYVSKLPCGLAIRVGGVNFDGCDPETGKLLEAKANIDFMFDANGKLYGWVDPANDPELQMRSQAEAAALAGRLVVWHAQTEKGYQALSQLADDLNLANLTVIFDPN